jgi:DNA polymerase-1
MFDVPAEKVTKEQRNVGKTINFSVVYGISSYGLSAQLKIGREEAQIFIDAYYKQYPAVEVFFEKMKAKAQKQGYLETVMGRRRYSEGINDSNRFRRQAAEREILNFTIQGSAADVMKRAMVDLETPINKFDAKLLLQIHDEFLFVIDEKADIAAFIQSVKKVMEGVHDIGVPYKVEAKVGGVWGEMEEQ